MPEASGSYPPGLPLGTHVFGKFEADKRWYAATITAIKRPPAGYEVTWCEGRTTAVLDADDIKLPQQILKKGLELHIIVPEKKGFYQDAVFQEYAQNGRYLCKTEKGGKITAKFGDLMVKPAMIAKLRKQMLAKKLEGPRSSDLTKRKSSTIKGIHHKKQEEEAELGADEATTSEDEYAIVPNELPPTEPNVSTIFQKWCFLVTKGPKTGTDQTIEIREKIIEMGGNICTTFDELYDAPGVRCLIASACVRTMKYIQCLAADIPCVSTMWINEVFVVKRLTTFRTHRLPAGISKSDGQPFAWNMRKAFLQNMSIGLYGDTFFLDAFMSILKAAKAKPVVIEEHQSLPKKGTFDLIVADANAENAMDMQRVTGTPVVNKEWVIETIIRGALEPHSDYPLEKRQMRR